MIIRDLAISVADTRIISATVEWEDRAYPDQVLSFEVDGGDTSSASAFDAPCEDAFLAACFPLAALHGETRVRIEGHPCPMLVEGLRTAHAWWASWGGIGPQAPVIESLPKGRAVDLRRPRRAIACLSGGVDGLHMLLR